MLMNYRMHFWNQDVEPLRMVKVRARKVRVATKTSAISFWWRPTCHEQVRATPWRRRWPSQLSASSICENRNVVIRVRDALVQCETPW
jgi:hypothetical protein